MTLESRWALAGREAQVLKLFGSGNNIASAVFPSVYKQIFEYRNRIFNYYHN